MAIRTPKAPLCKGGWQKSLISDWGIVKSGNMTTPPSKIKDFAHLPLHRGGFCRLRGRTVEDAGPYMMSETFQISVSLRGA